MEIESQTIISPNTQQSTWNNSQYKQRIIFYISVNGMLLIGFFIDYTYFRYHYMNKVDIGNRVYSALLFLALITYSYFKASLTSCGTSEANKYFYAGSTGNYIQGDRSITNISTSNYTNCEFCNKKKFLRSSHCRTCNVCVLRRDHHCVWIANCVGIGNNRVFFIFCLWVSLGLVEYLYDAVMFYWRYDEITKIFEDLKIGYVTGIILFFISFTFFSILFGVGSILFKQIHYIYNDFTYLEKTKAFFTEMHFPLWVNQNNEKKWNNSYNKGFLSNYYQVLGPTIFHGLFPIPDYSKYAITENSNLFKAVKQPHVICLQNHLRKTNYPGIKEIWEEQLRTMDPKNYLELSLNNYSDKILV